MSVLQSSGDHLTLNADGSSKNILFQADGVQKASISSAGLLTSTTIDATVLTGNLPAISGASLTGVTATDSTKLPLAGGTMSGNIVMSGSETVDGVDISVRDGVLTSTTTNAALGVTNAATAQTTANAALPKAGGTMTGDLLTGAQKFGGDATDYLKFTDNAQLDVYVNGNNEFRFEADGDFHADADVIAYSTTVSDATLKYNINPVEFALDKIKQLKGVTFNYFKGNKASAGLLAQDVEKVMPSAVSERKLPLHTGDDKSYKTLHYDSMTAILVEAIKELTAKVEKLENK